ncbi:MAG: bifunctional diguanylate cyclase/phosphodiesterase [Dermatophilaceae bacterium]
MRRSREFGQIHPAAFHRRVISRLRGRQGVGSARRLFVLYAAVSLIPILVLGLVLLNVLDTQGNNRGMAQARGDANLIARVSIAPILAGDDLRQVLTSAEQSDLRRIVGMSVHNGQILRLRLRDLDGHVVFSDDNSKAAPDDEALDAARGEVVSSLKWLNDDPGDLGPRGPRVVEVYEPLNSAQTGTRIGVLELYLPYAPIAADIALGQRAISTTLGAGLLILWLVLLLVSESVTDLLRHQSNLNARLAREDALTGLPNRARFTELITRATASATLERPSAIGVIDLDRFKQINDTLGHDTGDRLLVLLSERLKSHVGESNIVARLGGDEFGIVVPEVHSETEACELFVQLRKVLAEPLQIDGLPLAIEASIGFALAPQDGTDAGSLMQHADVAMYVAKQQHVGVLAYRSEEDQYDSSALRLLAELGEAITSEQLVLHYQPKFDLISGKVTSFEALVRWQHPTRGLLYPDTFVPAAEQTELIEPLTWWVLRRATLALQIIDPGGTLGIAVNVSARSLTRPDFADEVLAVLAETGTDPVRVIIEVTETMLLVDPPRAARTLIRLHEAGIRTSIDDFGAGQTSLGYLAMLPVSELKIDKFFVISMLADRRNAAIVRSVIDLGHSLGFSVTAEGVETVGALEHLTDLHCDTAQGFLMARPVPVAELRQWLSARSRLDLSPSVN